MNPKKHRPFITLTIIVILWALLAPLYPALILPSPNKVFTQVFALLQDNQAWLAFLRTLFFFICGLIGALLFGSLCGMLAGWQAVIDDYIRPIFSLIQAIPPISWIVLSILWFGNTGGTQIFIMMMTLSPIYFFNIVKGIQQTPLALIEVAQCFAVSNSKRIKDIYIPSVIPYFHTALILTTSMGWKTIVMAEILIGAQGIGYEMNQARIFFNTVHVLAWTVLLAIVGLLLEKLIRYLITKKGYYNAHSSYYMYTK